MLWDRPGENYLLLSTFYLVGLTTMAIPCVTKGLSVMAHLCIFWNKEKSLHRVRTFLGEKTISVPEAISFLTKL